MNGNSVLMRHRGTIGIGLLLLVALYLTSLYSYLLFHTVVELFTIVVAGGIFILAWNARAYMHNNYLLFIATASVFVAILDLFHALAYPGMGVFPGSTGNLTTQLWIAGRYLQAVSWVLAPFFLTRRLRASLQVAAYAAVTALLLWTIFYSGYFPVTYIDGEGLTSFKIVSEYVIAALFAGATALLLRRRGLFPSDVERLVVLYLLLTVAAEITFTTYFSVYSEASMVGHLLRWTAYFLLYTAIVETALVNPYSILLRDLKRSEDNLRAHASDLQAQNEELDAYAHSVAHDLKNPLTVVIAAADVINGVANLTRDELREYLGQIKDTAFEMNSIVDDLLLLSEVRKAQVPLEPTDMAGVVEQVERRLRPLVTKHGGCLVFPRMWPTAMGYAPWLREVWANYITNALKYGGPSPRIELGFDRLPGGKIRFWTRDYGPGIRADAAASLFVPFRQLRSKAMGGHGLGLSIVLRIVEKLGGQVGAEGAAGQGSIFYFTLDAIPASAETLATSESADGRSTEAAPAD